MFDQLLGLSVNVVKTIFFILLVIVFYLINSESKFVRLASINFMTCIRELLGHGQGSKDKCEIPLSF